MTARTWTEPATVVIPTELMADFEDWLAQRRLLLMGPARMSEDPEDLLWTIGPRREDLLAHRAEPTVPYDRAARLRAMGISEEQEREIRERGAEENRRARAQEEQARLARQQEDDYQGD